MKQSEINDAIYNGFYEALPNAGYYTETDFFNSTITLTWPSTPVPSLSANGVYELVAHSIQKEFQAQNQILPGFNGTWLAANTTKKWSDVAAWAAGPTGIETTP